jgi:hypothetical protein
MNKFLKFAPALLLLSLSSCETEENSSVTFYVSNAGDERVSDHIVVEIGDLSETFFTPESRNMSLSSCGAASNAAVFSVPAGTYRYTARGGRGTWNGSITVEEDQCLIVPLRY